MSVKVLADNSSGMGLVTLLTSLQCRSIILDSFRALIEATTCNTYKVGLSLPSLRQSQALYCKYYSSYKGEDSEALKKTSKKKYGPKVSLLDENGRETSMFLHEAEKYARRNNLKLVELPGFSKEKQKYQLQKVSELFQEKGKSKSDKKKKFIVKDVITEHDFQIKLNSMMKYVEKGQTVVCVIDAVDARGRLDEKLDIVNNSQLKDYLIHQLKSSKRLTLTFEKKATEGNESTKGQITEANKSS